MERQELKTLCIESLHRSREVLASLSDAGRAEIDEARVTDISTRGDMAVSDALIQFFRDRRLPALLYSEESGRIPLSDDPQYTITFDDIDGTDNYFRSRDLLPHCTVVTLFDSPEPRLADALIAGIVEHNTGHLWLAERGAGCQLDGVPVATSKRTALDRRTLIIVDHYMNGPEMPRLAPLYPDIWVKDFGSAALHLAGVSSGLFDAYIASGQKAHEIGAGYLLICEAGGFLSDWEGEPIDDLPYDFDARYPLVTAATSELGRALLSRL